MNISKQTHTKRNHKCNSSRQQYLLTQVLLLTTFVLQILSDRCEQTYDHCHKNLDPVIAEFRIFSDGHIGSKHFIDQRERGWYNDSKRGKKQYQRSDEHPELTTPGSFFFGDMRDLFITECIQQDRWEQEYKYK